MVRGDRWWRRRQCVMAGKRKMDEKTDTETDRQVDR